MRSRVRGVPPAPTEPQAGDTLGRYKVMEPLDSGALGPRYKVRHVVDGTYHTLRLPPVGTEAVRQALLAEGRVQRRVSERGLVRYADVFEHGVGVALVSEWFDGTPLTALLDEGGLETPEALAVFDGALAVVAAAHACGLTHEALGPDAVMLVAGADGLEVRIADFGLRRALLDGASALTPDVAADVRGLEALLRQLVTDGGAPRPDVPPRVRAALAEAGRFPDVVALATALHEPTGPSEDAASPPAVAAAPTPATEPSLGPALRVAATLLAVLAIVMLGSWAYTWPLGAARAQARDVDARLRADLQQQLAAAARLRAWGAPPGPLTQAIAAAEAAASPEARLSASERLTDAMQAAVQSADAASTDPAARREIERMIAAERSRSTEYRAVLARKEDVEASLLTPLADALTR